MAASKLGISYLVVTGVVTIALVFVFAVIVPLNISIRSLQAEIAARQGRLAEREAFLRTLDSKVVALATHAAQEKQLNVILPLTDATEDVARLIHQAQGVSGGVIRHLTNISAGVQSSLKARRARGEAVGLPDDITPQGFEVEFTGSYQQLRVLISQLQHSPRLFDITSLEIQRNPQVPDSVTATFTMQFYHYAEKSS